MLNQEQMRKLFKKEMEVYHESNIINPLEVFEYYYFKSSKVGMDYREKSYRRCIEERVDFKMTKNNRKNMMYKLLTISCPECHEKMSHVSKDSYRCVCGNIINIDLSSINIEFNKKEWFEVKALNPCEIDDGERISIPIVAMYEQDSSPKIIAEVIKYTNSYGEQVKINYLNDRAKGNDIADRVINKAYKELFNRIK